MAISARLAMQTLHAGDNVLAAGIDAWASKQLNRLVGQDIPFDVHAFLAYNEAILTRQRIVGSPRQSGAARLAQLVRLGRSIDSQATLAHSSLDRSRCSSIRCRVIQILRRAIAVCGPNPDTSDDDGTDFSTCVRGFAHVTDLSGSSKRHEAGEMRVGLMSSKRLPSSMPRFKRESSSPYCPVRMSSS